MARTGRRLDEREALAFAGLPRGHRMGGHRVDRDVWSASVSYTADPG